MATSRDWASGSAKTAKADKADKADKTATSRTVGLGWCRAFDTQTDRPTDRHFAQLAL
jgi:hypothetical protein